MVKLVRDKFMLTENESVYCQLGEEKGGTCVVWKGEGNELLRLTLQKGFHY